MRAIVSSCRLETLNSVKSKALNISPLSPVILTSRSRPVNLWIQALNFKDYQFHLDFTFSRKILYMDGFTIKDNFDLAGSFITFESKVSTPYSHEKLPL